MYSHISFWCSQIGSAFLRMNSSTSIPSIVGGRLTRFCLPFMKTVMYSSRRFFLAAFWSGLSLFFCVAIFVPDRSSSFTALGSHFSAVFMMSITALTHVHCSGCPSCVNPLYRELGNGSNIVFTRFTLLRSLEQALESPKPIRQAYCWCADKGQKTVSPLSAHCLGRPFLSVPDIPPLSLKLGPKL